MNYGYLIIYKKSNGKLLYRSVKHIPEYQKGEKNSYGWTVVDIQRLYNGKIYSSHDFDNKLVKKHKIHTAISFISTINLITLLKIILVLVVLYMFYEKI